MSEGRIMSACREGTLVVRMAGDLRFEQAPRFEAFIVGLFAEREFDRIVVDLNGVVHIDSTMLGLLVKLARRAAKAELPRAVMLSQQEDVDLLVDTMGFDAAFDIRREPSDPDLEMSDVPAADTDDGLPEHVLGAHRALMGLSDRNRRLFGPSVDMLQREVTGRGGL